MLEEKMERLDYLYNMLEKEEPSLLGFDQIYMINLERRPDRRFKMRGCFEELGIKYKYVPAVDGKLVDSKFVACQICQINFETLLCKLGWSDTANKISYLPEN